MMIASQSEQKTRVVLTRQEWEAIGDQAGWMDDSEPVSFSKTDTSILMSKLYGKGIAGRMAINMLKDPPQRDAVMAILDTMGQNWSYWRNVLNNWNRTT